MTLTRIRLLLQMEAVNKQGNLAYGMVLVGVYMALLELYIFSYKFDFFQDWLQ